MPRMTGEDVLLWLREHPQQAGVLRVVVVTAWAADSQSDLEELGAYAVLPKPLRAQQLHDLIAAAEATCHEASTG